VWIETHLLHSFIPLALTLLVFDLRRYKKFLSLPQAVLRAQNPTKALLRR